MQLCVVLSKGADDDITGIKSSRSEVEEDYRVCIAFVVYKSSPSIIEKASD